jgi:hypothetical protein
VEDSAPQVHNRLSNVNFAFCVCGGGGPAIFPVYPDVDSMCGIVIYYISLDLRHIALLVASLVVAKN